MDKKYSGLKAIYKTLIVMFVCVFMAGCGYSFEEMAEMSQYKKQGEINALNYIKEKYGFDATVESVVCEKTDGGGDFSPPLSGDVFVTLKHNEKSFLVSIAGDEVTAAGFDNYQYEEIEAAFLEKLYNITNLPAEELLICYGRHKAYNAIEQGKNGMTGVYFDGDNLAEVLTDQFNYPAVVVSYINQDVEQIDIEEVKELTGVEHFLFVDYDSKENYSAISKPYYNVGGIPLNLSIEQNMPYINGYRITDLKEDIYVSYEKKVVDGILLVTEYADEQVTLEKTTKVVTGHDFKNSEQVFDHYVLNTESEKVYVYVPLDELHTTVDKSDKLRLVVMDRHNNDMHAHSKLTEDKKYIGTTIYTRDYNYIGFSIFVEQD